MSRSCVEPGFDTAVNVMFAGLNWRAATFNGFGSVGRGASGLGIEKLESVLTGCS